MAPFLTINEVLQLTGVPRATYYVWRDSGRFPAPMKLGQREIVHTRESIESWLAANRSHRDPVRPDLGHKPLTT